MNFMRQKASLLWLHEKLSAKDIDILAIFNQYISKLNKELDETFPFIGPKPWTGWNPAIIDVLLWSLGTTVQAHWTRSFPHSVVVSNNGVNLEEIDIRR